MNQDSSVVAELEPLFERLVGMALARAPAAEIVKEVGGRLVALGVGIAQIRMAARTLHPSIDAVGLHWHRDGSYEGGNFRHAESGGESWLRSPMYHMISTETRRLRHRLTGPGASREFPVFADLAAEGVTDYLAHLLVVGERPEMRREGMIVRWLSDREPGFSDRDLAILDAMAPRMGAAILPGIEREIATNLLEAYVGHRSGALVLDGQIQPGGTQAIDAVMLVADLAGFTTASDRVAGDRLTELLGRHLEAMVPPVTDRGGEILAFMGDGFLAAFETGDDPAAAARAAVDSAVAIVDGVAGLSEVLPLAGLPALPVDVALHAGTVRYGNIGAGGRQAFTVIGPSVNAVSRIEALCGTLGRRILASDVVATLSGDPRLEPMGNHHLRGMSAPMALFGMG